MTEQINSMDVLPDSLWMFSRLRDYRNKSSMPLIAHVSRAFTEKRQLGLGWPGRYGAVSQHENPSLPNRRRRNPERLAAAIAFLLMLLLIQIRQSRSCTATG